MLSTLFATKLKMGQAWTKSGQRLAVTRLKVEPNMIIGKKNFEHDGYETLQIGYGQKKLKNMTKPLRTLIEKSGFSLGVRQIREVKPQEGEQLEVGATVKLADVIKVGDMVDVQGRSKGKGFAGVVKRHGFAGGPKTHGQSDRHRAPGAIGNRTTPGRVFKGKRMAGHMGDVLVTVKHLQVVHLDDQAQEVWLSGPVPGSMTGIVRLTLDKHGEFEGLDRASFSSNEQAEPKVEKEDVEAKVEETKTEEVVEEKVEEVKAEKTEEKVEK